MWIREVGREGRSALVVAVGGTFFSIAEALVARSYEAGALNADMESGL